MTAFDTPQGSAAYPGTPKRWQLWAFLGTTDRAAAKANFYSVDIGPVARCAARLGATGISAEELGAVHVLNDAEGDYPCYDAKLTKHLSDKLGAGEDVTVCSHSASNTRDEHVLVRLLKTAEEAYNSPAAKQQRNHGMLPVYLLSGGTPLHAGVLLTLAHRRGYEGEIIEIDHETGRVAFLVKLPPAPLLDDGAGGGP